MMKCNQLVIFLIAVFLTKIVLAGDCDGKTVIINNNTEQDIYILNIKQDPANNFSLIHSSMQGTTLPKNSSVKWQLKQTEASASLYAEILVYIGPQNTVNKGHVEAKFSNTFGACSTVGSNNSDPVAHNDNKPNVNINQSTPNANVIFDVILK